MSTKVEAPQPSAEEQALQREQLSLLQQQRAETEAFKPLLYEQMGLREVDGKLEKVPWEERLAAMSPQERAGYDLNELYLQRQMDALAGNLPVSPAMEAELTQQRENLMGNMSRKLGSNWALSTPGIQSMSEFDKRAELLREEARRGQISTGEGLLSARAGILGGQQAQNYGQMSSWNLPQFQGLSGAYSNAYQPFQFNRNMQFQANQQTAANRAGLIGDAFGLLGTVGGAGLSAY